MPRILYSDAASPSIAELTKKWHANKMHIAHASSCTHATIVERTLGYIQTQINHAIHDTDKQWWDIVDAVVHVHDVASASTVAADEVGLNDLAVVRLSLSEPIAAVPYRSSREGGRMILIDEATNVTAGALLLSESVPAR